MEFLIELTLIILGVIIIHKLHKLNKTIMGAEATVTAMIEEVIAIVTEAFNTNVGDLTEAEAEAKKAEFVARINAIINPPPTP